MRLERLHVAQQHGAGQSWPGHQGVCQPAEAMLGTAVKAAATNTDKAREGYGEKAACLCFSDSSEDSGRVFSHPLAEEPRFL